MKLLLLLSTCSICLSEIYVQNLPEGTVVYGTLGEVTVDQNEPSDCVLHWDSTNSMPKVFIYNSREKTCTPLTSVLGTKSGNGDEEAYIIELDEQICQKNVTKAVEDIIGTKPMVTSTPQPILDGNCFRVAEVFEIPEGGNANDSILISSYYNALPSWENQLVGANFRPYIYSIATKYVDNLELSTVEQVNQVIYVLEQFMGVNEVRKELVSNIVIKGWGTNEQLLACKL
uniref:Uncharacterized protein n=1 Tax=Steinernema glaseri TaxID=37863 RepID=A0A1I8A715_9BILA